MAQALSTDILIQQFSELPPELREAIARPETADAMSEIAQRSRLTDRQLAQLASLTGLAMGGALPPREYVAALKSELGLTNEVLGTLVDDVAKLVFLPINPFMATAYGQRWRDELKNAHLVAPAPQVRARPVVQGDVVAPSSVRPTEFAAPLPQPVAAPPLPSITILEPHPVAPPFPTKALEEPRTPSTAPMPASAPESQPWPVVTPEPQRASTPMTPPRVTEPKTPPASIASIIQEIGSTPTEHVVFITHGGALIDFLRNNFDEKIVSQLFTDLPEGADYSVGECSITRVKYENGDYTLVDLNQTSHLK